MSASWTWSATCNVPEKLRISAERNIAQGIRACPDRKLVLPKNTATHVGAKNGPPDEGSHGHALCVPGGARIYGAAFGTPLLGPDRGEAYFGANAGHGGCWGSFY